METKERTSEQAVEELKKLHGRYKDKPRGERLTAEKIKGVLGIQRVTTISRWMNGHSKPVGLSLGALNSFLDRAKDRAWIDRIIKSN